MAFKSYMPVLNIHFFWKKKYRKFEIRWVVSLLYLSELSRMILKIYKQKKTLAFSLEDKIQMVNGKFFTIFLKHSKSFPKMINIKG